MHKARFDTLLPSPTELQSVVEACDACGAHLMIDEMYRAAAAPTTDPDEEEGRPALQAYSHACAATPRVSLARAPGIDPWDSRHPGGI